MVSAWRGHLGEGEGKEERESFELQKHEIQWYIVVVSQEVRVVLYMVIDHQDSGCDSWQYFMLLMVIFQMPNVSSSVEYNNVWKWSSVVSVNFITYVGQGDKIVRIESMLLGNGTARS